MLLVILGPLLLDVCSQPFHQLFLLALCGELSLLELHPQLRRRHVNVLRGGLLQALPCRRLRLGLLLLFGFRLSIHDFVNVDAGVLYPHNQLVPLAVRRQPLLLQRYLQQALAHALKFLDARLLLELRLLLLGFGLPFLVLLPGLLGLLFGGLLEALLKLLGLAFRRQVALVKLLTQVLVLHVGEFGKRLLQVLLCKLSLFLLDIFG